MSKFMQVQQDSSEHNSSSEEEIQQKQGKKSKFQVQNSESEEEEEKPKKKSTKKSKFEVQQDSESEKEEKKSKKKSKFQVQQSDEEDPFASEEEEKKKSKKSKKKDKKKSKKQEEEQEQEEQKPKVLSNKDKKRLKQLEKQQQEEEDVFAEFEQENKQEQEKKQEQEQENKEQQDQDQDNDGQPKELSKAQLKRMKKKQKDQQKKENDGQEQEQEQEETENKNKKKKGGAKNKAVSSAAAKIQEQLRKQEEEKRAYEEKLRQAKEEEEARIAAEIAAEEEKKRLKEEEKARKKKDGTYETRAQKKKREALEKARRDFKLMQEQKEQLQKQQQQDNNKQEQEKLQQEQKQKQQEQEQQKQQQEQKKEAKKEEEKRKKKSSDVPDDWDADFTSDKSQSKKNSGDDWEMAAQKEEEKEQNQEEKCSPRYVKGKKKKSSVDETYEDIPKDSIYISKPQEKGVLRSPIICIMGHVDTGKTTLLDKLRHTNVQGNEAGGITQQIGATFFPGDKIKEQIRKCENFYKSEVKAPGLLVIDTPGHESFANLRSRGSGLCDFAILVIDLMHGIEQQTLESIKLLTLRKTPFVIALNKIDRCYDWKAKSFESSYISLKKQKRNTNEDFQTRYQKIVTQLAEIEKNAVLYWDNQDIKSFFPIVPTSGVTGEGIPDLLSVIIKYTSFFMRSRMMVKEDAFNCTVMEVKMIEGHGTTIDCILIDGVLKKGDTITVLGFKGAITTKIRALLTPHPMKEMRVKGEYISHDKIYAAMGLKIAAKGLEECCAGSQLVVSHNPYEQHKAEQLVEKDLENVKNKIQLSDHGVGVAASTLGSLEALLSFLKESKIPVSYVTVGPVSRDDINKAMKALLADEASNRKKEYATMLVFDVKVLKEASEYAEQQGVKVFQAQIIYHLQDQYMEYYKKCLEERRQAHVRDAIFPCQAKCIQVFRANKPLLIGVKVEKGQLRIGTPLVAFVDGLPKIGTVEGMESNGKPLKTGIARAETGDIAVKLSDLQGVKGGHTFGVDDTLVSLISRHSIDCLKEHFKDQVSKDEWLFIKNKLKPLFEIY